MPPTKWYLNLDSRMGRHAKNGGTVIKLSAFAMGQLFYADNATVDWSTDYGGNDGHEDFVAAGPTFNPVQSARNYKYFTTRLTLPMVTGRTYTVRAKRTDNQAQVLQKQYETAQRVYLTVHTMNARCRGIWNWMRPRLEQAFAPANIEFKIRTTATCVRDEPFTASDDPRLGHLYRVRSQPLDRAPCHIRLVIVNDLAVVKEAQTDFSVDNTTAPDAEHRIRLSTRGDDHAIIVYENPTVVFNADAPFARGAVIEAWTDAIDVPAECVGFHAENPRLEFVVDVDGDESLALLERASQKRERDGESHEVEVKLNFRARRCPGGFSASRTHSAWPELSLANGQTNPVVGYGRTCWLSDGGRTAIIEDPLIILAEQPAASIQVKLAGVDEELVLDVSKATRVSDTRVQIDLGGNEAIAEALAANDNTGTIELKVGRRGVRKYDDVELEDEDDHEITVSGLTYVERAKRDGIECGFDYRSHDLVIFTKEYLLAEGDKPTVTVTVNARVKLPEDGDYWTVDDAGTKFELDLSAHAKFAVAAAAMRDGRPVRFDGRFRWRQSLGGYNLANESHFVALTTRTLGDWTEDDLKQRTFLAFSHEVGHALGLTPQRFYNHATANYVGNDRYYTNDQGGQGPHCHHNADLVAAGSAHGRPDTHSGQLWWYRTNGDQLCIMYHAIKHEYASGQFCAHCRDQLIRSTARFTSRPGTPRISAAKRRYSSTRISV